MTKSPSDSDFEDPASHSSQTRRGPRRSSTRSTIVENYPLSPNSMSKSRARSNPSRLHLDLSVVYSSEFRETAADQFPEGWAQLQPTAELRRGKWGSSESTFVDELVSQFHKGIIADLPDGTSLRAYLATALRCDPMRITKKYQAEEAIGKRIYRSFAGRMVPSDERKQAQSTRERLAIKFVQSLHDKATRKRGSRRAGYSSSSHAKYHSHSNSYESPVATPLSAFSNDDRIPNDRSSLQLSMATDPQDLPGALQQLFVNNAPTNVSSALVSPDSLQSASPIVVGDGSTPSSGPFVITMTQAAPSMNVTPEALAQLQAFLAPNVDGSYGTVALSSSSFTSAVTQPTTDAFNDVNEAAEVQGSSSEQKATVTQAPATSSASRTVTTSKSAARVKAAKRSSDKREDGVKPPERLNVRNKIPRRGSVDSVASKDSVSREIEAAHVLHALCGSSPSPDGATKDASTEDVTN